MSRNTANSKLKNKISKCNCDENDPNGKSPSAFFQENPALFRISPRPGGFLRLLVPSRSQDFMAVTDIRKCSKECCPTMFHSTNVYKPLSDYSSTSSVAGVKKSDRRKKSVRIKTPDSSLRELSDEETGPYTEIFLPTDAPKDTLQYTEEQILNMPSFLNDPDFCPRDSNSKLKSPEVLQQSMEMLAVTISCAMQMAAKFDVSPETLVCAEAYLQCMKDRHGRYPRNIVRILNKIRKSMESYGLDIHQTNLRIVDGRSSKSSIGSSIFNTSNVTLEESTKKASSY